MSEQVTELRRINWSECFSFLRIFKAFRMAIQPGKLGLALAGVVLMGVWGWVLDGIWPASRQPVGDEIGAFWQVPDVDAWREQAKARQVADVRAVYAKLQQAGVKTPENLDNLVKESPGDVVSKLLDVIERSYGEAAAKETEDKSLAVLAGRYNELYLEAKALKAQGIFRSFMEYEQHAIAQMLGAARGLLLLDGNALTRGFNQVFEARRTGAALQAGKDFEGLGVLPSLVLMMRGAQWLITEHWFFALLFLLGSLAIWSLFGGAICRMAALNVARDEQIPLKSALAFARRKFVGFFSAPLLPVILVVVIGVMLFVGGLVLIIPGLGELLGGLLMVLALMGGAVIALVLVGAAGGGSLLWPTVAVEGSDGFDAMSRSYSYFYSRPWRTAFYCLVATVYGAVAYVFARLFVLLTLKATRWFVALGGWFTERPGTGTQDATKLHAMWPDPTPGEFLPPILPFGGIRAEFLGAILIRFWVILVVLLLCAFLVSFYFSVSTIIYSLLRHKVDATDFEDVYLEEEEEEPAATTLPATEPSAPVPAESPAPVQPQSPPADKPEA